MVSPLLSTTITKVPPRLLLVRMELPTWVARSQLNFLATNQVLMVLLQLLPVRAIVFLLVILVSIQLKTQLELSSDRQVT